LDFLKKSLKLVREGNKKGIPAPLILTLDDIQSSSDVFPIDFLDMKLRHKTIFGKDYLLDVDVAHIHLRLQCEQELKGKLIRLREVYLEVGLNEKRIQNLIYESYKSLIPVLRTMILLKGADIPENVDVLEVVSELYAVDVSLCRQIDSLQATKQALEDFFASYIALVANLAHIMDTFKVDES